MVPRRPPTPALPEAACNRIREKWWRTLSSLQTCSTRVLFPVSVGLTIGRTPGAGFAAVTSGSACSRVSTKHALVQEHMGAVRLVARHGPAGRQEHGQLHGAGSFLVYYPSGRVWKLQATRGCGCGSPRKQRVGKYSQSVNPRAFSSEASRKNLPACSTVRTPCLFRPVDVLICQAPLVSSEFFFHVAQIGVCSLPMQTQNISSSIHHIKYLNACMKY
jgi:hypothetical protein